MLRKLNKAAPPSKNNPASYQKASSVSGPSSMAELVKLLKEAEQLALARHKQEEEKKLEYLKKMLLSSPPSVAAKPKRKTAPKKKATTKKCCRHKHATYFHHLNDYR